MEIHTKNGKLLSILTDVNKVINSTTSVLITGETGTGKEVLADYIHNNSNRKTQPLVKISLSSLPRELIESELFGYERGSFTGAITTRKGLFEHADKGTVFLDDIDDFPIDLQVKLLRILENSELIRVGGLKPIRIDIRILAATKVDLNKLVSNGFFRPDLYYRLNVIPIQIPPLRERKEDIPLLVDYFLKGFSDNEATISEEIVEIFKSYPWPGNIRELKNLLRRLTLLYSGEVTTEMLPEEFVQMKREETIVQKCSGCFYREELSLQQVLKCLEKRLIREAIEHSNSNISQAASLLKINRSTLNDRIKKLRISF